MNTSSTQNGSVFCSTELFILKGIFLPCDLILTCFYQSSEHSCKYDLFYHSKNHSMMTTLKTNTRCIFILSEVNVHNCINGSTDLSVIKAVVEVPAQSF